MVSAYKYGRRKELQVAEFLIKLGHKCSRARGSRGSYDLLAVKTNRKWAIQVKSTKKDILYSQRVFSADDLNKLEKAAKRIGAKPILALVSRKYFELFSLPGGKPLLRGKLKPLSQKYPEHR